MERTSPTIRIDGPYGSHHARALLQDSGLALLVAGGSGIAVAWPLMNFLLEPNITSSRPVSSPSRFSPPSQKIVLIWIIHRSSHISCLGWPALQKASAKGVQVIIPTATEEAGRPDLHALMRSLVVEEGAGRRVAVMGSGPDSMGRAVRNACEEMVRDGWNIGVTMEKFGW